MTERLARASSRRPWLTVCAWVLGLVLVFGIIAVFIGGSLTSNSDVTAQTESKRAQEVLDEAFPPTPTNGFSDIAVVRAENGKATDPVVEKRVDALATQLRGEGVANVVTYYKTKDKRLLSADGKATAVLIGLGVNGSIDSVVSAVRRLDAEAGYEAAVTGDETINADFDKLSQEDLRKGELFFGAPAALIILVLVFGAVVAGLIPLLLAIVSIIVALALTALVGQVFELSVLFSGIAFVLAMVGMTLVPDTILRSLAVGAILVGIVSVAAALTLMPAILSILGDRVNSLRVPIVGRTSAGESRFWSAIVRRVMRRPVVSLVAAVALLLAVATPVLSLKTGQQGISTLPDRFESKQGFLLLNKEFPGQTYYPVQIVVDGNARSPAVKHGIARLESELATRKIFGKPIAGTDPAGDVTALTVPIAGDADSEAAT